MGTDVIPIETIRQAILLIRGQKVMLDRDLAALYGVETRVLNQAVKRHRERFPPDFMLLLTREEIRNISQSVICSASLKHARSVSAFTDDQFRAVFDAIRELMAPPDPPPKPIGFHVRERRARYGSPGKRKT